MNKIEKLLLRVSLQDRLRIESVIEFLATGNFDKLDVKKIKKTDFFRVRVGRFRIIFHRDQKTGECIIDGVKLRDKDTYK
ncbi:MAG: hypothetical protein ABIH67_04240 [Candidatus Uhrbacteria bacterium]